MGLLTNNIVKASRVVLIIFNQPCYLLCQLKQYFLVYFILEQIIEFVLLQILLSREKYFMIINLQIDMSIFGKLYNRGPLMSRRLVTL